MALATAPARIPVGDEHISRQAFSRSRATPVRIQIEKHEIVGRFMDCSARAGRSIDATGHAIDIALRHLPPCAERDVIQAALHDAFDELKELLKSARMSSKRYESEQPLPDAN